MATCHWQIEKTRIAPLGKLLLQTNRFICKTLSCLCGLSTLLLSPEHRKNEPTPFGGHWAFCVASCLPWPTNFDNCLSIWERGEKRGSNPFKESFSFGRKTNLTQTGSKCIASFLSAFLHFWWKRMAHVGKLVGNGQLSVSISHWCFTFNFDINRLKLHNKFACVFDIQIKKCGGAWTSAPLQWFDIKSNNQKEKLFLDC